MPLGWGWGTCSTFGNGCSSWPGACAAPWSASLWGGGCPSPAGRWASIERRLALPVGKRRLPGSQRDQRWLVLCTRRQVMILRQSGRWEQGRDTFMPHVNPQHDWASVLEPTEAPDTRLYTPSCGE